VSQTFSFVNAGSNDYLLAAGDTGAQGNGENLVVDTYLPVNDDIIGNYRPGGNGSQSTGNWDIGANQRVSATVVNLISFTATEYKEGVYLRWQTGYEADNLGFHVYREGSDRQLYLLTPEMIAGSALLAGSKTVMTAGRHYEWWDTSVTGGAQASEQKYWIEDVDLSGKRTMHGPAYPEWSDGPLPGNASAELLSKFYMTVQGCYKDYQRAQALRDELSQTGQTVQAGQQIEQSALAETEGPEGPYGGDGQNEAASGLLSELASESAGPRGQDAIMTPHDDPMVYCLQGRSKDQC
jgi:hypothetical protein